jgi:hypothetical protein
MNLEKYMFPCLSKTLLGVECLGCGFQRSLLLLFQGEFVASFELYPAIFTSLFFLISWGATLIFKGLISQKTIIILALLNVCFMIGGYAYHHF